MSLEWLLEEPEACVAQRIFEALTVWRFWRRVQVWAVDSEREVIAGRVERALARFDAMRKLFHYLALDVMQAQTFVGRGPTFGTAFPGYSHVRREFPDDRHAKLVAISQRIAPLSLAARHAAHTATLPVVEAPAPKVRKSKRRRVEHEDTIQDVRTRAASSGNRAVVRDCDLILRGHATATSVLGFLETHAEVTE